MKSTTTIATTATTGHGKAARRDKAQLNGVLHVTTIGHRTSSAVWLSPALELPARTYSCRRSPRGLGALGTAGSDDRPRRVGAVGMNRGIDHPAFQLCEWCVPPRRQPGGAVARAGRTRARRGGPRRSTKLSRCGPKTTRSGRWTVRFLRPNRIRVTSAARCRARPMATTVSPMTATTSGRHPVRAI